VAFTVNFVEVVKVPSKLPKAAASLTVAAPVNLPDSQTNIRSVTMVAFTVP